MSSISSSFANTLGAILVGFALSCCVYGMLVMQIFVYLRRYPSDRPVYKLLVFGIWLLETVDQVFIAHIIYFYGVKNYANPEVIIKGTVVWSLILQLTVGSLVEFVVKSCFVMRVWRFSNRNTIITAAIILLNFGHLGTATVYTVKCFALPNVFAIAKLKILGTVSLGASVATDVAIAGSLCWFLGRLRTGRQRSDTLVNTLTRYAIETGILTSTVSITTLVLYNVMPKESFIFISTYFILSKLYANSFLAILNTRKIVKGRHGDRQHTNSRTKYSIYLTRLPGSATQSRGDVPIQSLVPDVPPLPPIISKPASSSEFSLEMMG